LVSRVKPVRAKLSDWGILVLLSILLLITHLSGTKQRYIPTQNLSNVIVQDPSLLYPYKANVMVPFNYLMIYSIIPWILLCILTFLSFPMANVQLDWKIILRKFEMIARMWFSTLVITQLITEAIKNGVGRPRPNFYQFIEVNPTEPRLSFPSGHASFSFSMLSLLTIHLYYCILYVQNRAFFYHHHHIRTTLTNSYSYFGLYFFTKLKNYLILCLVIAFLPIGLAMYIAISRVLDYWHDYSDIIVGGIIGTSVAIVISQSFHFEFYGDRDPAVDDENNDNNAKMSLLKSNEEPSISESASSHKREIAAGKNSPSFPLTVVINRNNKQTNESQNDQSKEDETEFKWEKLPKDI